VTHSASSTPRRTRAARTGAASDAVAPDAQATLPDKAAPTGSTAKSEVDATPLREIGGSEYADFNHVVLRETLATIWFPGTDNDGDMRRMRAGMAALKAFKPRDEIEGMLAAQAVALHFGAMECFRRAMIPDQPGEFQTKLRKDGANLARGMTDMLEALDRKRGKGPQVVRVERVVVNDGGRAFVGNVSPGIASAPPPAAIEAAPAGPTLDLSPASVPVMADRIGRGER